MRPPTAPRFAAVLALLFVPSLAHAHITLTDPPARHPAADLKSGPCGNGPGDTRTTDPLKIKEYTAGATITIEFDETVQHPGHYRIMLSSTGDAGFSDPTGYEDTDLSEGDLIDGVDDPSDGSFGSTPHSIEVTLPNEACEECTIQLIQVMYDKMPWGPEPNAPQGADIYYQCADIVILPGAGGGSGGASSTGGGSGSGSTGGDSGDGGAASSGGAAAGSGGATSAGGSASASGGAAAGSGGTGAGGAPVGSGGDTGSGGGGVVPPANMASCSFQAGSTAGGAGWLTLAGLAGLAGLGLRRRRSAA